MQYLELLDVGSMVQVGNRLGVVVKAEYVQAHPCGVVPLHTIKYTHKLKILICNRSKWEPLAKKVTATANYAHITPLNCDHLTGQSS